MKHSRSHTDNPGALVAVAAIAGIAGALVAALLTPRKGSEVRGSIKEIVKNNKDRVLQTKHGLDEAREEADKETKQLIRTLDADEDSGDTPPPHVAVTSTDIAPAPTSPVKRRKTPPDEQK